MADIQKMYELWVEKATADPDLKAELADVAGDEEGKNDRFYIKICIFFPFHS